MMCAYSSFVMTKVKEDEDIDRYKHIERIVPCGHCLMCRLQKTREWKMRMEMENQFHTDTAFITLTFREKDRNKENKLLVKDVQDFMKRVRYYTDKKYAKGRKLKYFAVGEHGDKLGREHYHLIIWGLDGYDRWNKQKTKRITCSSDMKDIILKSWTKGRVYGGLATGKSCGYVAGYVQKKIGKRDEWGDVFMVCSKGISKKWIDKYYLDVMHNGIIKYGKNELTIPRYFIKMIKRNFLAWGSAKDFLMWWGELKEKVNRTKEISIDKIKNYLETVKEELINTAYKRFRFVKFDRVVNIVKKEIAGLWKDFWKAGSFNLHNDKIDKRLREIYLKDVNEKNLATLHNITIKRKEYKDRIFKTYAESIPLWWEENNDF